MISRDPRSIKVAFLSPMQEERDGIGVYSRDLYPHLSTLCTVEPHLLDHKYHPPSYFRFMAEKINRCDILHVEHNFCYFNGLIPFREAFRGLLRKITIPRLVVYHELVERIGSVPLPRVTGLSCERAKGVLLFGGKVLARPLVNSWWLPRYNREIFTVPEKVVVHSEFYANIVDRFAPGVRPVVMPLPVPAARENLPPENLRATIPFGGDDRVLTIFGFIDRRKDYLGVLQALTQLPREYKLLIAGSPHDERDARSNATPVGQVLEFIRARELESRVHITGFFPETCLPAIIEATSVILAPFTEDHCSASINIGLAYARPIVAYATRLTNEMNRNGAGILCVERKEQLPLMLERIIQESELRQRAVEAGREYKVKFDFRSTAFRFVELYEEMTSSACGDERTPHRYSR